MKRVFVSTFMITLIVFFTAFGLCESYIVMQNTTSKDKITSVMEGFIDKEKKEVKIHLFGEELLKFPIYEVSLPSEFSAFVPTRFRLLWMGIKEGHREVSFYFLVSAREVSPLSPRLLAESLATILSTRVESRQRHATRRGAYAHSRVRVLLFPFAIGYESVADITNDSLLFPHAPYTLYAH